MARSKEESKAHASFVDATYAFLTSSGHTSPQTATLLSRLAELPSLANIKPTNTAFKLKDCMLRYPEKFALRLEGSTNWWIHAVPPQRFGDASALGIGGGGAAAVRGVSSRLNPSIHGKGAPAAVPSELSKEQRMLQAAVEKPSRKQIINVASSGAKHSTLMNAHDDKIDPCIGVVSCASTGRGAAIAGGGAHARVACSHAASSTTAARSPRGLSSPSTSYPALTTRLDPKCQSSETERFKRCAVILAQSQKSNVNAHGTSTDQMLQVFLHFTEVSAIIPHPCICLFWLLKFAICIRIS
jgi:hypothetical protein